MKYLLRYDNKEVEIEPEIGKYLQAGDFLNPGEFFEVDVFYAKIKSKELLYRSKTMIIWLS